MITGADEGWLEKLALGEIANEVAVRCEEIVSGKVFEADPAHVVEDAILELAGKLIDGEELQVDGTAVTVVVANLRDSGADRRSDA